MLEQTQRISAFKRGAPFKMACRYLEETTSTPIDRNTDIQAELRNDMGNILKVLEVTRADQTSNPGEFTLEVNPAEGTDDLPVGINAHLEVRFIRGVLTYSTIEIIIPIIN